MQSESTATGGAPRRIDPTPWLDRLIAGATLALFGAPILGDLLQTVNERVEGYLSGTRLSELVDVFGDVQTCGSADR